MLPNGSVRVHRDSHLEPQTLEHYTRVPARRAQGRRFHTSRKALELLWGPLCTVFAPGVFGAILLRVKRRRLLLLLARLRKCICTR